MAHAKLVDRDSNSQMVFPSIPDSSWKQSGHSPRPLQQLPGTRLGPLFPRARPSGGPWERGDPPTVFLKLLGLVGAVEELPLEQLHGHHSKDEHEQHVDNEDVEDVLERIHHTVKHSLMGGVERGCEGLGPARPLPPAAHHTRALSLCPFYRPGREQLRPRSSEKCMLGRTQS